MPKKISSSPRPLRLLVLDGDPETSHRVKLALGPGGGEIFIAPTSEAALGKAAQTAFDAFFIDVGGDKRNLLDLFEPLLRGSPWAILIATSADGSIQRVVEAIKRGASDFLPKPLAAAVLRQTLEKVAEARETANRDIAAPQAIVSTNPFVDFASESAPMRDAVALARHAAPASTPILITGEPGVGKRTLGRAIHAWSARSDLPFAMLSCRAPSRVYLESEWLGSTAVDGKGITCEKRGRIAQCAGGTLLIEEIDLLTLPTQQRLLRLIQEGEYERLGDATVQPSDVRVLATTEVDLEAGVRGGSFLPELLEALRGITLSLTPLRHRPKDTVMLAERFLSFFARQTRRNVVGFDRATIDALQRHSWPGNIRELRNLVERMVTVARGERIEISDFPQGSLNRVNAAALGDPVPLERIEELHIRGVLAAASSMEAAATTLGIDSVTLWRRRKRYGI